MGGRNTGSSREQSCESSRVLPDAVKGVAKTIRTISQLYKGRHLDFVAYEVADSERSHIEAVAEDYDDFVFILG